MITAIKSQAPQTLVIALGNALCGDDGAGMAILNSLATTPDLPKEVTM